MATAVLEAVEAERKIVSDIRTVLRKLAASRVLSVATKPANLARLTDKAFRQEFPSEKADNRLASAIARGIPARRKLAEDEGGSISAEQAAQALGISKQAILKRYQKGQVIGWREERQNAVRFPVWQFSDRTVLPGIEQTLQVLNAGNRLDDFGRMLFFLSNQGFLGGRRAIECLRKGEVAKVYSRLPGAMSSSPARRPVRLPPPDLATQHLTRTREKSRAWFRVHPRGLDAIYFSLNPGHRFSHPKCPNPILYVAIDPETCLLERFGDYLYDNAHQLPQTIWDGTVISRIRAPVFRLCDLSRTVTRTALTVDLAALMSAELSVPQQWGLEIQNHPSRVPAIKFKSRFTGKACLAIFELPEIRAQLKASQLGPLSAFSPALDWLTKHQVTLV